MNILVVNHDAILSADRGLYRTLKSSHDVEIALLVPFSWQELFGPTRFEPEQSALPVFASRTLFTGRSHRAIYLSLGKILKQVQPDFLWVNGEPESYLSCQAVLLRNRFSPTSKVVFNSYRNIDYLSVKFPYKFSSLNAWCERLVLRHADHCIAHNETAKEIFRKKGFERVTVTPPWVDLTVFRKNNVDALRDSLGLQGFTVGYVGRFTPLKGVDLLLRAAKGLPFDCKVLLVGDGPAKCEWINLAAELQMKNRIVWVAGVRHEEVPSYLNAIDVLVLPSHTGSSWKEQFGRILIEAMACEVPVVGSTSGEIPNVIANAGLIFREGDIDDLRQKLLALCINPEKSIELGKKGLQRVQAHFSIPIVARQYYVLFDRLLNHKGISNSSTNEQTLSGG